MRLTLRMNNRLFGVTTLDVVRSSAFLSTMAGTHPAETNVPVVGGHSGVTIVPLLSQTVEGKKVVEKGGEVYAALVKRIQFGGDEVVKAKDGAGSATLSMAYGALSFHSVWRKCDADSWSLRQLEPSSLTPSSRLCEVTRTLSSAPTSTLPSTPTRESPSSLPTSPSACVLSLITPPYRTDESRQPNGVETIHPVGKLAPSEQALLDACLPDLAKNIAAGVNFMKK